MMPSVAGTSRCREDGHARLERDLALSPSEQITELARLRDLPSEGCELPRVLEAVRLHFIIQALARSRGVQARAAGLLGISARVLNHYITTRHLEQSVALAQGVDPETYAARGRMRRAVMSRGQREADRRRALEVPLPVRRSGP